MQVDSSIIAAIIACAASIIVAVINTNSKFKDLLTEIKVHNAEQDGKIESLTEECRKHNSVLERQYKIESRMDVLEAKMEEK